MGKTELADQFLRRMEAHGEPMFVATGRCLEQYGTGEAYLPFMEVVRVLLTSRDGDAVARALTRHAPSWSCQFPGLMGSGGAGGPLAERRAADRMLHELADFIEALSATRPVVLLLEDLHWADPSSSDLLRLLGQRAVGWRALLLGTFRGEQVDLENHPIKNIKRELLAHDLGDELALPLLDAQSIHRYLGARLSPNAFPRELDDLIARTTEGQPFFATRLVQLLVDRGEIERADGMFRLTRPVSELRPGVPETVRGVIERKLDSLGEADRRALEYGSVIGVEFTSATLADLLELDEMPLQERLGRLARVHRLLEDLGERRLPNGRVTVVYRFSHVLYQDVLYDGLASRRRMVLHERTAETLISQQGAEANQLAAALAIHFEGARRFDRAIHFLMLAADNAGRLHANREASQHYGRALALVEELPTDERTSHYVILNYNQGWGHYQLREYDASVRAFEAMLRWASAPSFTGADAQGERARARAFDYFAQPWRDAFGVSEFPRMPNQDASMGAAAIQCEAYFALCHVLRYAGRVDEMAVQAQEYLRLAEESRNAPRCAEALVWTAFWRLELFQLAQGTALLDRGIELARSLGHTRALFVALHVRAGLHHLFAEHDLAEAMYAESFELSFEATGRIHSLLGLGLARMHLGRISAALAAFEEASDVARRADGGLLLQKAANALGAVFLELGDWNRAAPHFERAVAIARQIGNALAEAQSWIHFASLYTDQGKAADAEDALDRAERLIAQAERDVPRRGELERKERHARLGAARAEHLLARGELQRAEKVARALLAAATDIGASRDAAVAQRFLARARLARGELAAAHDDAMASLAHLSSLPAPLVRWKILATIGEVRLRSEERDEARRAFEEAHELVTGISREIVNEELRATWESSPQVRAIERRRSELSGGGNRQRTPSA